MDTQGSEPGAFGSYDRQAFRNEEILKKVAQFSRVERSLARRRTAARRFDGATGPISGRFQCVVVAQQRFRPTGGGEVHTCQCDRVRRALAVRRTVVADRSSSPAASAAVVIVCGRRYHLDDPCCPRMPSSRSVQAHLTPHL